jgi:hypothetical protein
MSSTDPVTRKAFITGLRDLADYLDANPGVPVPGYGHNILVSDDYVEDGGKTRVERFAAEYGLDITDGTSEGRSYRARRFFGPVGYEIYALTRVSMARYHAENSYQGCVMPDTETSI